MLKNSIMWKISFADSFTIINGISGLISIFYSIKGSFYTAFILILISVLADGLDGIVARKFGSFVGKYMDEFSDTVSFCVSPCIFAFLKYEIKIINPIFLSLSSIFLIFGILHLISYHIGEKNFFNGLTTPASAIILLCISYLNLPLFLLYTAFLILSFLMVLSIPYPRIERYNSIFAVIIIFLAMTGLREFIYLLLFSTIIYVIFGPFYLIHNSKNF
ncbi:MAG: CDP-alcohol phosphatidyltransferase family protein [Thermoplasmatales archaeon]|nr:CDP-alcohol phosphatidyltransferase family protein [Thermoplasmatales archaeon]